MTGIASRCLLPLALSVMTIASQAEAQMEQLRGPPGCVPVSERKGELGCCIVAGQTLGELPGGPLFWHLDSFASAESAKAAAGPRSTVVQALGQTWLMTVAEANWQAAGATRVASVGPFTVKPGVRYVAAYLEAVMLPGATSSVHFHPGPEALYTVSGEECMETAAGKFVGRPGGTPIVVPADMPHKLTITGTDKRRSLGLLLYDNGQPMTIAVHDHQWTPLGLCNAP